MLLAGLISTASISRKSIRTLADAKTLEVELISQCGSGELDDYKPSRTNMARMKLEGQLDVAEYIWITVSDSVHMGDPAGGYVEKLKARKSARTPTRVNGELQSETKGVWLCDVIVGK